MGLGQLHSPSGGQRDRQSRVPYHNEHLEISDRPPAEYLPAIEERYPGALSAQFVPIEPELWKVERFPEFSRSPARDHGAEAQRVHGQPDQPARGDTSATNHRPHKTRRELRPRIQEYAAMDAVRNERNKALRHSSLKTVNAFMNSQGGTLVIGVEDDGGIYGLDRDLSLTHHSKDRFEQLLTSLIAESMGATTRAKFQRPVRRSRRQVGLCRGRRTFPGTGLHEVRQGQGVLHPHGEHLARP